MIKYAIIIIAVLCVLVFILFKIVISQSKKTAELKQYKVKYDEEVRQNEELADKIKTGITQQSKLATGNDTTNFNNSIDILHELASGPDRTDAGY